MANGLLLLVAFGDADALVANDDGQPVDPARWTVRFREALSGFRFLPGGRILAGAGTKRHVTLFNCFVMGTVPDSLDGIFEHLKEAAVTMQQGGGVGMDFSTVRPSGAPVLGVGAEASGPLTFMDCWDSMCRTVHSAGQRRGAMMGCLAIDHPDIEAFIDSKRDAGRFRNFNISVLVSDAFMAALAADAEAAGWDGFFVWDHLAFVKAWKLRIADPWMLLTGVALATERLRLGPMVTPLARRRPQVLAHRRRLGGCDLPRPGARHQRGRPGPGATPGRGPPESSAPRARP